MKLICLLTALNTTLIFAQFPSSKSQEVDNEQFECHYFGHQKFASSKSICDFLGFRSNNHAEEVVDKILRQVGLTRNFVVVECPNTENCFATVYEGKRYIVYDGAFMKRIEDLTNTDWSAISIVAHEIGHHLQGHTIDGKGSRPQKELEADRFSGFVMQRLGATLEEALIAIKAIGDDKPTYSHPAKADRIEAIRQGWADAAGLPKSSTIQNSPPIVATTQEEVEEQDENIGCIAGNCDVGKGVYVHESGERYEGDFRYGKRHGIGVQYYADGRMKYKGDFKNDRREGYGAYYFENGDKYVGLFLANYPNGKGTYYYVDGDIFVGIFENGKRNGQGAFYRRNGVREVGLYQGDQKVR